MARPRKRIPLMVYLNSRLVGRLNRQASGAIDFHYDGTWLSWEHAIPVSLSLPLREDRYIGDPVVAVFDNLLPDNEQIRHRMAVRVKADGYDAYSLLAAVGRDCVGALQFLPEGSTPAPAGTVDGRPATDAEIAQKLRELGQKPLGVDEDDAFRISIAGAQEKTALLYRKGRWHIPYGTTATTHILKPQIGQRGSGIDLSRSVENEYFCMKLTQAFGVPAAEVDIADFDDLRVLVVERFDRRWTRAERLLRLPQEDCCQALSVPPTRKYEPEGGPGMQMILKFLQASDEPKSDQEMFLRAQVLFWLLGTTDGHAKNFSVFLMPGGRFRLTPLYDVMSAQPNFDAGELRHNQMKLAMAVGNKRHYAIRTILPRHFVQIAAQAGFTKQRVEAIFSELVEVLPTAVEKSVSDLPKDFPAQIADSIIGGLQQRRRRIEDHLATRIKS